MYGAGGKGPSLQSNVQRAVVTVKSLIYDHCLFANCGSNNNLYSIVILY